MEAKAYIVLGPLAVADMAATHPDIISGYPMPTAVAGFGYRTVLEVNRELDGSLKHLGTAVVVHRHSLMDGHPKNPVEMKGKLDRGAPIVDEYKARAELTFIIAVDEELELADDGDIKSGVDKDHAERFLARKLPGWLFGGGKVFVPSGMKPEDLVRYVNQNEIQNELRRIPPGYVLVDRRDLMEVERSQGGDSLDALFNCIEAVKRAEDGNGDAPRREDGEKFKRRHPGWIVPLLVGFQGIERPVMRGGTRVGGRAVLHVYAESLYSVGEYRSLRSMLAEDEDPFEASLWRHCRNKPSETFYVSAIGTI